MRLYTPGAWGPGPHGVPSLSGRLVWVWLNRASRWAPSPARPEPPGYLGGVPTPAGQSGDPGLALIDEAVIEELFKLDSGVRLQIPAEPTPETAAVRPRLPRVAPSRPLGTARPRRRRRPPSLH